MQNRFEEDVRFRSYAQPGQFDPGKAPDIASTMEREYQKYLSRLGPYERSMEEQNKVRTKNAGMKAREDAAMLKELGSLSKTALGMWQDVEKQSKKDIEIGETYDALFGGVPPTDERSTQDAETVQVGEAQGPIVANLALEAEERSGNPESGEVVRRNLGGLAEGVAGEKALLIQAQSLYPGWLTSYLQSDATITVDGAEIPVRAAAASTDSRIRQLAITQGRYAFIEENGLQNATKANVVRYLSNSVIAAEAAISGALARSTIKEARDAEIDDIEGVAYSTARNGNPDQVQDTYTEMSSQLFVRNTGLTRGQASDKAIAAMIKGYVAAGNVDALRALNDVLRRPGQQGTELWRSHGAEIDRAIQQAEQKNTQIAEANVKEIEAGMYQQLNGVTGIEARQAIVEEAAQKLEDAGQYEKARQLRLQQAALSVPGNAQLNEAEAEQAILNGEITELSQLDQLRAQGLITQTGYTSLVRQLNARTDIEDPKNNNVKDIAGAYFDRWESEFDALMGMQRDPITGQRSLVPGDEAILSVGEANIINQVVKQEMNAVANTAYRQHAGLEPAKREQKVREALQAWYEDNVLRKGGKYYTGDLKNDLGEPNIGGATQAQQDYWSNLANSPAELSRAAVGPAVMSELGPRDLTSYVYPGVPPSSDTQLRFNPLRGDRLFTRPELRNYYQQMSEGRVPPGFAVVAQGMGMTPLAMLNNQLLAYPNLGLEPLIPGSRNNQQSSTTAPSGEIQSGLQVAQKLVTMGLPLRSAAYLAGNVVTESSVNGRRTWDDVGAPAGGLLSWRAERLTNLENRFGRNVKDITHAEQLAYLVDELRTTYPQAYRIFMNPYATDRQLREASFIFIGWGTEGDRFPNATRILSQLSQ